MDKDGLGFSHSARYCTGDLQSPESSTSRYRNNGPIYLQNRTLFQRTKEKTSHEKAHIIFIVTLSLIASNGSAQEATAVEDPNASFFHLDSLMQDLRANDKRWTSFIKGNNVLTGLYHLKAGREDRQQPHDTDEVYYVVEGKAKFIADDQETPVTKGSILFVKAEVSHRFAAIEEDLVIVVFFDQ